MKQGKLALEICQIGVKRKLKIDYNEWSYLPNCELIYML